MRNQGRSISRYLPIKAPLVLFGLLLGLFWSTEYALAEAGRLAVVNGDVRISANTTTDKGRTAKPNDLIQNNDIVITGSSGTAKLLFTDQSIMDVGPNSALKVSDYALRDGDNRTGVFSLMYGKLRALVTKKVGAGGNVQVKSGQAVMGVRGTEFMVDTPKGGGSSAAPTVLVVTGTVSVAPLTGGPPISVGAGQMVVANVGSFAQVAVNSRGSSGGAAAGGKPTLAKGDGGSTGSAGGGDSPVVKVSGEQMQSMLNGAKAEDNTFTAAVNLIPAGGGGAGGNEGAVAQLGSLMANNVNVPPPTSESGGGPVGSLLPAGALGNGSFLPPVSIVPGNPVRLSIIVQ